MNRLQGKIAIVAGGAGGIGSEVCRRFLEEGATVICADRSRSRGEDVVRQLAQPGRDISFGLLDAASSDSWNALVDATVQIHGRVDILVTGFYSGPTGTVESMDDAGWNASFAATSTGVFYGMRSCAAAMTAGGSIVNIASFVAHGGAPENIGYSSAKASVIAMSRAAAAGLAERGIRVNIVTPGIVETRALDGLTTVLAGEKSTADQVLEAFIRKVPLKRVGKPVEIANAILFLASDEASYVTGAELIVDGGIRTA